MIVTELFDRQEQSAVLDYLVTSSAALGAVGILAVMAAAGSVAKSAPAGLVEPDRHGPVLQDVSGRR